MSSLWVRYLHRFYLNPLINQRRLSAHYATNIFWDNAPFRPIKSLQEEKAINETARTRVVQIVCETRPDDITSEELKLMRRWSITRVQLGIQHTDDAIMHKLNRKCTLHQVTNAIEMCKSVGLKVDGHFMPNLPGTTPEKDRHMFIDQMLGIKRPIKREIKNKRSYFGWITGAQPDIEHWEYYNLTHPELQVDQLKIYECAVVIHTEIEKWYKNKEYIPYDQRFLIDMLLDFKSLVFPWIRINRIQRDFYADNIFSIAGSNLSLRCTLQKMLLEEGKRCQCIRCREVKGKDWDGSYVLLIRQYNAGIGNTEYFISVEDATKTILYGFVRLRLDTASEKVFPELNGSALIRELHVYSKATQVGKKGSVQHNGLGTFLMSKAENIAKEMGYAKLHVIASVGSRTFYSKIGYIIDTSGVGEYMVKYVNIKTI